MKIDDLEGFVDEVIEEGLISDPASLANLLLALDQLEGFVTSSVLSYRLSRAAWKRGGVPTPKNPSDVTPS
jgi:hypothetical protein